MEFFVSSHMFNIATCFLYAFLLNTFHVFLCAFLLDAFHMFIHILSIYVTCFFYFFGVFIRVSQVNLRVKIFNEVHILFCKFRNH